MVARVTTLQLQPGKLDAFLRIFQDAIAPATAAQPGFGGITLLTDPQLGKVVAVGLWGSEADLLASEHAADPTTPAEVDGLLIMPPLHVSYDVGLQVELNEQGMARIRGI
jgi:heme-degrading monooxygenase HmoA